MSTTHEVILVFYIGQVVVVWLYQYLVEGAEPVEGFAYGVLFIPVMVIRVVKEGYRLVMHTIRN